MSWATNDLSELFQTIWQSVERSSADMQHPFRTPALGTIGTRKSSVRTVVLRKGDSKTRALVCYSDYRAPKITDILANPATEWLFYHPADRIQIRASGVTKIHYLDPIAGEAWGELPTLNRIIYCASQAPGKPITKPVMALAPGRKGRRLRKEETEIGWPNFAVIVTTVDRLDWLHLGEPGHRRAGFTWNGTDFAGTWLAP
jgi:pyridoxamine 5'-phosphate oxidase